MRIATVQIGGSSYPAAFSLRVLKNLEDRSGKPGFDALAEMMETCKVEDVCWLLAEMLKAGAAVAESDEPTPTADEIMDKFAVDDLHGLTAGVLASLQTVKPTLEADTSKKTKAKQKKEHWTLFG